MLKTDLETTNDRKKDSEIRKALFWVSDFVLNQLGKENVRSLITTGSLATGEGSAFFDGNGQFKLLSDIDLIIVSNDGSYTDIENLNILNNNLNILLNSAKPSWFLSPIDTVIMKPEDVRNWWTTPRIDNLQLSGTACIIWGDENVLPTCAPISVANITDYDIFKLFNNRVAEQIFYLIRYHEELDGIECFVYHSAKAAVDTVLAVCTAAGNFQAKILDRIDIFRRICSDPLLGKDIMEWAEFWMEYKFDPDIVNLNRRFHGLDKENAALLAWNEAAYYLLKGLHWTARRRSISSEQNTLQLVMSLSKRFAYPLLPEPSPKVTLIHPMRFFRHWLCERKRSHVHLFIDELQRNNLKVFSFRKIKELSALGSPTSLTYACATLLLEAKDKSKTEQKKILRTVEDILPGDISRKYTKIDDGWMDLASETARLWNILVMDGRR
jgi:hypothetical protein